MPWGQSAAPQASVQETREARETETTAVMRAKGEALLRCDSAVAGSLDEKR